MTTKTRNRATKLISALAVFGVLALMADDVRGFGIGEVMKAKSLPDATVAVIDPETGTSDGTAGSDVNLAIGDIILFRFSYAPVPDKSNRSIQSYVTEYLPPNTEIVGVRIIDQDGRTLRPKLPGMAIDGCTGGSNCNTYTNLPCNDGADNCSFAAGSVAQVHADTGIFYSTDPRLARTPADQFLASTNGILMNPAPASVPDIDDLLDITAPYYSHNAWDWTQVRAYGVSSDASGSGGDGNTPYGYGSPVAGPGAFYPYEATENGAFGVEFNNVVGPWQRIRYPGSKIGFGDPNMGASGPVTRKVLDASATGFDVTPANPIQGATAIRWALGEARTGQAAFVEVALRVTAVPIDGLYNGTGGNVNCGEVTGSGLSARTSGFSGSTTSTQPQTGATTAWAYYLGSSACVFLRLKFDITSDKALADGGPITFTLNGKNLSVNDETGVVVRQQYDSAKLSYVAGSASLPPDGAPAACPPPDTTLQCLTWTLGTLAPSDEYQITTVFNSGGGGQISATMEGVYNSNEIPTEFRTRDLVMIVPLAQPVMTVTTQLDQTVTPAQPGTATTLVGTLSNAGTNDFNYTGVVFELPAGWTGAPTINIGGTNYNCMWDCGTNKPAYDYAFSMPVGGSRDFTLNVNVPAGAATGLYPITTAIWGSQTGGGFGGEFETSYEDAVTIAVGAPRTQKPVLDCPIGSTNLAITGTSEPNADIRVLFTLMERGTGTSDGAGDFSVSNFGAFGEMYGGLEVRATAQAQGELESEPSEPCEVTALRACSDSIDNDGDGNIDFPADIGCDSPTDSDETDTVYECSDSLDNDASGQADYPADSSCYAADDPTEDGVPTCSDGIDNDGDGATDFPADPDCTDANDGSEAYLRACQNRIDDDGDGLIDHDGLGSPANADPGCHSAFDDDESDVVAPPGNIEARLLVVFDTSGSMNWNTCESVFTGGDGSVDCAGGDVACAELPPTCTGGSTLTCDNGLADDSRLYKVKAGLSDVVSAFGEVEYGLMRFHQREESFACPTSNASYGSGGWQGGGAAPCDGGFAGGDVVVSFAPDNQQTILSWLDGDTNYPGAAVPTGLDFELRGSGTTPLDGALTDALTYLQGVQAGDSVAACRPYRVILVTDGQETCGGDPVDAAAALRAAGMYVTVIGFATDDPAVVNDLNAIANAGSQTGNSAAIFVDDEAALSEAIAQVITDTVLVETCNNLDDDCDTLVDEDFSNLGDACDNSQLGVCYQAGNIVCRIDGLGTECTAPDGSGNSTTETCNVMDDDCDGLIDEGLNCPTCTTEVCNGVDDDCDMNIDEGPIPGAGDSCGIDIGECTFGALDCVGGAMVCVGGTNPQPTDVCDGLDEDCDSFVDEGFGEECYEPADMGDMGCVQDMMGNWTCNGICRTGNRDCVLGMPGECLGDVGRGIESCNGLDDDCDGLTDEDYPNVGMACDNGQLGICQIVGTIECLADGSGTYCTAPTVPAGIESCNGFDDDCDGNTDESLGSPIGLPCGGAMDCTMGVWDCVDPDMDPSTPNSQIECVGGTGGNPEECNGFDDDCDTMVDEDIPGQGADCYTFPAGCDVAAGTCDGICQLGMLVCTGGGVVCQGDVGPNLEVCNGVDDDCDGVVDNMAQCPSPDQICVQGSCVSACESGEFPCPAGQFCDMLEDTECAPNMPPCLYCLPDLCLDANCPDGWSCDRATGECSDPCLNTQCPAGETCRPVDGNGVCFDCFDNTCAQGQWEYCCGPDELCVSNQNGVGECQVDPCAGVQCDPGSFCQDGVCACADCDPACGAGEICNQSTCSCEPDPCAGIACPGNQVCDPTIEGCEGTDCCVNANECFNVNCPQGQVCNPSDGTCCADPCIGVQCPSGFVCEAGFGCSDRCVPAEDDGVYVFAGGSGCDAGGGSLGSGGVLLMLVCGMALFRRRRRALL